MFFWLRGGWNSSMKALKLTAMNARYVVLMKMKPCLNWKDRKYLYRSWLDHQTLTFCGFWYVSIGFDSLGWNGSQIWTISPKHPRSPPVTRRIQKVCHFWLQVGAYGMLGYLSSYQVPHPTWKPPVSVALGPRCFHVSGPTFRYVSGRSVVVTSPSLRWGEVAEKGVVCWGLKVWYWN